MNDADTAALSSQSATFNVTLAKLLSRLAALQGEAVPAFRFELLEHGRDGAELATLARDRQACERWQARFPEGGVTPLALRKVQRGDYPLLWVAADNEHALLIRGRQSNGVFSAEDSEGNATELTAEQAAKGQLLHLTPTLEYGSTRSAPRPQTAKAWFRYALGQHKRVFVEGIIASVVISLLGLFTALYTMQVYDRVVPTKGFSTLWVLSVGVAVAIALEFLMKQSRAYIVDLASKKIDLELSEVFFGKAMDIRMDARPATVGTLASQIRHFESVRNFMTSSTLYLLADAPLALFFVGVIAMIGGPVALVPLVMIPVALLSSLFFLRKIKAITAEHMQESNQKNGLLIEAIDGIESVKAAGGEWKMADRHRELTATIAQSDLKLRKLSTRATNMSQAVQQANYVGMIAVGAFAITEGLLTMGALIACSIIAGRALTPISQLPQMVMQWNHARIALEALDNIMAMPSDRDHDARLVVPEQCRGEVSITKAAFHFHESAPALSLEDLRIAPGERVAVIGAVGSGKSTLIKLLSGLYKPTSGSVYLDDMDMQHLAPAFLREHIGYLPQDVRLFNGTLRDNLTLALPTPSDSRVLQACQLTGLDQVIANHPEGLALPIAEGGRGLSGGQRQLVGLTRLLLLKPRIMLLDEPTAAMDATLEARVMRHLFQEIPPESSLVVVTHKTAVLKHVERIIVLDKGQRVYDGPRDKVLAAMQQKRASSSNPATTKASTTPHTTQPSDAKTTHYV
ncbi:type I secretion system permease/ATPase [Halomonas sp. CH40]